ncbi:MAG: integrin alpha [Nostoc sp.]|uniref:integrin alpha n=1 Tax=Nostoc sp. TaxID=1180 RepID=UPI002FF7701D
MALNPAAFNLSDLDGNNGFAIAGSDLGYSSTTGADINNDGIDDLIIGTPFLRSPEKISGSYCLRCWKRILILLPTSARATI